MLLVMFAGYGLYHITVDGKRPDGPVRFTISPETTIITQPIGEDGYVDYVAACNAESRQGVTPEKNLAVVMWEVCGPQAIPSEYRQAFFHELGIETPPAEGDYLVPLATFAITNREILAKAAETGRSPLELIKDEVDDAEKTPWTAEQRPWLARWLAGQEAHLDRLVAGLDRPHFFQPLIPEPGQPANAAMCPGVDLQRMVTRALTYRAMHRIAVGDDQGAWADIHACHQLAMRYATESTLIARLVAIAANNMAVDAALAWLQFKQRTAEEIAERRRSLEAILEPLDCNPFSARGERYMVIEAFREMATEVQTKPAKPLFTIPWESVITGGPVAWDEMAREVNRRYSQLPKYDAEQGWQAFREAWEEQQAEIEETVAAAAGTIGPARKRAREQAIVALFYKTLMPAWIASVESSLRNHQRGELIRVAFALEQYRAERGQYPELLDALVPDYLKTITPDRFNDVPLYYAGYGNGCHLASAGPVGDLSDDRLYLELGEAPPDQEPMVEPTRDDR